MFYQPGRYLLEYDESQVSQWCKEVERNTITLLFSLNGLKILYQQRSGQVKTIVIKHFNAILFHNPLLLKNQHNNQSIN